MIVTLWIGPELVVQHYRVGLRLVIDDRIVLHQKGEVSSISSVYLYAVVVSPGPAIKIVSVISFNHDLARANCKRTTNIMDVVVQDRNLTVVLDSDPICAGYRAIRPGAGNLAILDDDVLDIARDDDADPIRRGIFDHAIF